MQLLYFIFLGLILHLLQIVSSWDLSATERMAAANRAARCKTEDLLLAGIRAEKNEIGIKMDVIKEKYEENQKVWNKKETKFFTNMVDKLATWCLNVAIFGGP